MPVQTPASSSANAAKPAPAPDRPAEEHVLVVPAALLDELGRFQGFTVEVDRYLDPILRCEHASYRPRAAMEIDPSFKQLIPYVLFRHTDGAGAVRLFTYQRGGKGGEARLHARRSVGVGGHLSLADAQGSADSQAPTGAEVYRRGLERELDEEVRIGSGHRESIAGLINDDSTPVGSVHLGVVHVFDLDAPAVEPREEDLADPRFELAADVLTDLDRYEAWSQIAVRALFGANG